jgi:hypothetical protein
MRSVTLNATGTGEPIRKHLAKVFHRAGREAELNVKGSFEEGSGR